MKILVTGGSGFIGSRLVECLLAQGHEVLILDLVVNPRFERFTVQGDVADATVVDRCMKGVELVFNLAAQHRDDVFPIERYYDTNVKGMRVICNSMSAHGVTRFVFTSSVAVYGFKTDDGDEETPTEPENHYGRSKLEAEGVMNEWLAQDAARVGLTIRPCAVFGPRNRGNIYNLLAQVMSRRFLMVGTGNNRKSIAYVENVVEAILFLSRLPSTTVVNYADKPDLTMNEFVRLTCEAGKVSVPRLRLPRSLAMVAGLLLDVVARASRRTFPLSAVRVTKFCSNSVINADRIRRLGFAPPHRLEDGLRATIRSEFDIR
jgi:GlcNAc-P-P-Und epimerase